MKKRLHKAFMGKFYANEEEGNDDNWLISRSEDVPWSKENGHLGLYTTYKGKVQGKLFSEAMSSEGATCSLFLKESYTTEEIQEFVYYIRDNIDVVGRIRVVNAPWLNWSTVTNSNCLENHER